MPPAASPYNLTSISRGFAGLADHSPAVGPPIFGTTVMARAQNAEGGGGGLGSPLSSPTSAGNFSSVDGRSSRKRKHSSMAARRGSGNASPVDAELEQPTSPTPRKQRACDQCKQQKLKCDLVENPFTPCARCQKFGHNCEITDSFKRVAKRYEVSGLKGENETLRQEKMELEIRLQQAENALRASNLNSAAILAPMGPDSGLSPAPISSTVYQDHHGDAQLLLQLKQGQPGHVKSLGDFALVPEVEAGAWNCFWEVYHNFLPILDDSHRDASEMFKRNHFLFWTVIVIALRHRNVELMEGPENTIYEQILPYYKQLLQKVMVEPPLDHLTVKAWCLLCYWPVPISTSNKDLTMSISGLMMKHAMQLGLHRPSHPDDFSRNKLHLRQGDINDRLRTWVACNIVAQNVSTGYGQPADTVYDATLTKPYSAADLDWASLANLHGRLEVERIADEITRDIYSVQNHPQGPQVDASIFTRIDAFARSFADVEAKIPSRTDDVSMDGFGIIAGKRKFDSLTLDTLFCRAALLHLRLHVFSTEPPADRYTDDLHELYSISIAFLESAFDCGLPLRSAPNYIMQMMFAAAVALLKLLNSSYAASILDRNVGEQIFWQAISAIREMSVRSNDLTQRLSEVFAQMWKADAERYDANNIFATVDGGASVHDDLKLKRRARMSMSHVHDSVWRWKEEISGKIRAEQLDAAVKNPTSPLAMSHRDSLSTSAGRRSADPYADPPGVLFSGVSSALDIGFDGYNEYALFDAMNWDTGDGQMISASSMLFGA